MLHHSHSTPTPRLGGVAVFCALLATLLVLLVAAEVRGAELGTPVRAILYLLAPAAVVFLVGLLDDFRPLSARFKLLTQIFAALVLVLFIFELLRLPHYGSSRTAFLIEAILKGMWLLAVTNGINLIDGLDGLAAGNAIISALVILTISWATGDHIVALCVTGLCGALVGFLRFNFNPARMFLGDCGSLFVGFLLSSLALASLHHTSLSPIMRAAVLLMCFGLPLLDTGFSVLRRFMSGRPVFSPDREHIHHMLLQLGLSHRHVVVCLYAVSLCFAMASLLLWRYGSRALLPATLLIAAPVWFGLVSLRYHEIRELRRLGARLAQQREIVRNDLVFSRAANALESATSLADICRLLAAAFQTTDFDACTLTVSPWAGTGTAEIQRFQRNADGSATWAWRQHSVVSIKAAQNACWSLQLCLVTTRMQTVGQLKVFRSYTRGPLVTDINMLTNVLAAALTNALMRMSGHRERAAQQRLSVADATQAIYGASQPAAVTSSRNLQR